MALDGIYLYSLIKEIKDELLNCRIDKINQPEKDEIILNFKVNRKSKKLLISASANYARINFIDESKENPLAPPIFCMVLRKYLNTATLIDVRQVESDRILILDFESTDELGFNSVYSLVVEIMGRHSNITLIRQRDNTIMDCIKHVSSDVNSYRILYPSATYVNPPKSSKLYAFDFSFDDFKNIILNNYDDKNLDEKLFSSIITGVSNPLSKEIYFRLINNNIDFSKENLLEIFNFTKKLFSSVKEYCYSFKSYSKDGRLKDFHCVELTHLLKSDYDSKEFSSPSDLMQNFFYEKDKADRLNARSYDLQRIVNNNIDRVEKKINILNNTLKECEEKPKYNLYGELITSNIYGLKKGDKIASVLNYYSENEEYIDIPLNENKTPSENAQIYFKKYNKLKKSEENATIQIDLAKEEEIYLHSVLSNILNADNYTEINDIKNELIETGYIAFKKSSKDKKVKASKPLHFVSSDGLDIFVGKNNLQNDFLTLKFASKNDLWFHTKNIPGSHVIVKSNGNIPETTLVEAATLAAFYSKAKNSSNVPVDYTEIKNVRKMSGAKPGMVIYYTNKTIYITPKELDLKSI